MHRIQTIYLSLNIEIGSIIPEQSQTYLRLETQVD